MTLPSAAPPHFYKTGMCLYSIEGFLSNNNQRSRCSRLAAGMVQGFTGGGQASVAASVSGSAGDSVCLVDTDGNVLVSVGALGDFSWVCASCPGMEDGAQYSLVVGGTVSDADSDGFAQSGSVEGGSST